jgi:hypothetical protein
LQAVMPDVLIVSSKHRPRRLQRKQQDGLRPDDEAADDQHHGRQGTPSQHPVRRVPG